MLEDFCLKKYQFLIHKSRMSVRVSSHVWESSKQTGDRLLLMLALADFADEQGVCWPSQAVLAAKVRCSVRWVQKMLADLKKDGEIEVKKQGIGRGQNTEYQIVFSEPKKANVDTPINGEKTNVDTSITTKEKANSVTLKGELCDVKPELHNIKGERIVRTNHHRTVKEPSKEPPADLPLPFDSPDFAETWEQWKNHRREIRKKLTPTAVQQQFALCRKVGKADAIEMIQTSIRNGWTGLFEPQTNRGKSPAPSEDDPFAGMTATEKEAFFKQAREEEDRELDALRQRLLDLPERIQNEL